MGVVGQLKGEMVINKHAKRGPLVRIFNLIVTLVVRGLARLSPRSANGRAERVLTVHQVVMGLVQLMPRLSLVNHST